MITQHFAHTPDRSARNKRFKARMEDVPMTDPIDLPPLTQSIINEFHRYTNFSTTHVMLKLKLPYNPTYGLMVREALTSRPDLFENLSNFTSAFRVTPAGKRHAAGFIPPSDPVADTVRNFMGVFDTPVERLRRKDDPLYEEMIATGRRALAILDGAP